MENSFNIIPGIIKTMYGTNKITLLVKTGTLYRDII